MHDNALLSPGTVVCQANKILFSRLDQEFLAIDAQAGYCYSLNEPAQRIWELIAEPTTIGALCGNLRQEYPVDEATCLADVSEFLAALHQADLVEIRPNAL